MSMTDPIADFLTRLRNAANAQHHDVTMPSSKLNAELARILASRGTSRRTRSTTPSPDGRAGG